MSPPAPDVDSARDVAPDDVAPVRAPLASLVHHPLRLRRHQVEQRVAAHGHEAVRPQQRLDLRLGPAAQERELIADARVFLARAGTPRRRWSGTGVEPAVHDDQASAGPENAHPLVDGRLRMGERPQQVAADDEVEAAGRKRQVLGVGLLEANRDALLGPLRRASASIAGAKSTPVTR